MKKASWGGKVLVGIMFLFLYLPILVLVVFSFNASKSRSVWAGFTFDWYKELITNSTVLSSLTTTLEISILAAVISTVIGTFAAIGFYNMKKRYRTPLMTINNIPVMNADIITGVSLALLFISGGSILHYSLGFGTLLLAHISFDIPYVILSVMPKLYQLDKNQVDAARDLGCTWMQAFIKVIIPEISPGIFSGMMIAFTMSIDDFVISYFTAGSKVQTLSMTIYAMTRKRVSPEINALSTILFVFVLLMLIIINAFQARQDKIQKKKEQALRKAG